MSPLDSCVSLRAAIGRLLKQNSACNSGLMYAFAHYKTVHFALQFSQRGMPGVRVMAYAEAVTWP